MEITLIVMEEEKSCLVFEGFMTSNKLIERLRIENREISKLSSYRYCDAVIG